MIKEIEAKTLLSSAKQQDPWFGVKYTMNLYRGCQHQCIYCDSRSECYQIENFSDILIKSNALELLPKELASKRVRGTIGLGSMNDSYMPIEAEMKLTQRALKIIAQYRFPLHIMTKNKLVLRDIELIRRISEVYAAVSFSVTTADDELARVVEPGASAPSERFLAMRTLADEGILTGTVMMPILPFLGDTQKNITAIVTQTHKAGGKYVIPSFGMTLRDRQRAYYYEKLDEHFPGLRERYERAFGNDYSAGARNSRQLERVFVELCKQFSIDTAIPQYEPGDKDQLSLL